ncbi:ogr/Delta-like zinc finger family protein, partial [Proteus mirabilis]|nr:ogr/Delta-like zinc finger family protein [Proteus mirabilis]
MRVLTIYCPECGEKAMIKKSNRKHKELTDLYCACRDPLCGHTFVLNLTFSHTLSPS